MPGLGSEKKVGARIPSSQLGIGNALRNVELQLLFANQINHCLDFDFYDCCDCLDFNLYPELKIII